MGRVAIHNAQCLCGLGQRDGCTPRSAYPPWLYPSRPNLAPSPRTLLFHGEAPKGKTVDFQLSRETRAGTSRFIRLSAEGDAPPTRRCSERKPADSLRDKSNVIGGWLPLASALSSASFSRPPMPLPDFSDAALLLLGHGTDLDPQSSAPVYRTRGGIAAARELQMRLAWRASQINLFVWNGLLTRAPTGIFFCWPWPFMG